MLRGSGCLQYDPKSDLVEWYTHTHLCGYNSTSSASLQSSLYLYSSRRRQHRQHLHEWTWTHNQRKWKANSQEAYGIFKHRGYQRISKEHIRKWTCKVVEGGCQGNCEDMQRNARTCVEGYARNRTEIETRQHATEIEGDGEDHTEIGMQ